MDIQKLNNMEKYKNIKSKIEYDLLLNSGMMWEFHPELTGSWNIDKKTISPNSYPKPGEKIAVWFSSGAASAVAAKMTLEEYGDTNEVLILNNPIKEEDPDNIRFLHDCEKWLGVKIHSVVNSKYPNASIKEVFEDQNFMTNVGGLAYCTLELKQRARFEWEIKNRPDWTVLGFTKEEKNRFDRFKLKRLTSLWVLENTTKAECFQIIQEAGIKLPMAYLLGMPNANCKGCVKATSPTYWNLVRKIYPQDFKERAQQSREIGAKLVRVHAKYLPWAEKAINENGVSYYRDKETFKMLSTLTDKGKLNHSVRIQLDELPQKAKGRALKDLNFECGIFCSK